MRHQAGLSFFNVKSKVFRRFRASSASVGPDGKKPADSWKNMKQFLNFYVGIYVKYIYLMRKIEDSHDQIIHVQIREMVKKFIIKLLTKKKSKVY